MMDIEVARNMWSFMTESIWINCASAWLLKRNICCYFYCYLENILRSTNRHQVICTELRIRLCSVNSIHVICDPIKLTNCTEILK